MPIYEFKCNNCGAAFDKLCRVNWEGSVTCPGCGAADLMKVISLFSAKGGSGCGSCGSKNCGSCK